MTSLSFFCPVIRKDHIRLEGKYLLSKQLLQLLKALIEFKRGYKDCTKDQKCFSVKNCNHECHVTLIPVKLLPFVLPLIHERTYNLSLILCKGLFL